MTQLNRDYLDTFFGDTSVIPSMDDDELRSAIASLAKMWSHDGDYGSDDPGQEEIFDLARELYPYNS